MIDRAKTVKVMQELLTLIDAGAFIPSRGEYFHGILPTFAPVEGDLGSIGFTQCRGCMIAGALYAKAKVFDAVPVKSYGYNRYEVYFDDIQIRHYLEDYFTDDELHGMEIEFEHYDSDHPPNAQTASKRMRSMAQQIIDKGGYYIDPPDYPTQEDGSTPTQSASRSLGAEPQSP